VIIAVSTERTIGMVILAIIVVFWIGYVFVNIRQSKAELGAEVELAPNRSPLPDDEHFEGPRLEKVQAWGVVFLAIIGVTLPLYWLREPGRQDGAQRLLDNQALSRGEESYVNGFQCASCHGADLSGGAAPTVISLPRGSSGEVVNVQVNWAAPALDDVFYRFDTDVETALESTEVRAILNFGRAPVMPAWGLPGGGPANEQQIQDLLDYMFDNQVGPDEVITIWRDRFEVQRADAANDGKSDGQVLYELNCARCHTPQFSARGFQEQPTGASVEILAGQDGAGGYGRPLSKASLLEQFPDPADQIDFVSSGAKQDVPYGTRGLGTYGMPGFGTFLTDTEIEAIVMYVRTLSPDPNVTSVAGDEIEPLAAEPEVEE